MKYLIRPDVIRKEAKIELPVYSSQPHVRAIWRGYVGTSPIEAPTVDKIDAAIRNALLDVHQRAQAELDALLDASEGGAD